MLLIFYKFVVERNLLCSHLLGHQSQWVKETEQTDQECWFFARDCSGCAMKNVSQFPKYGKYIEASSALLQSENSTTGHSCPQLLHHRKDRG